MLCSNVVLSAHQLPISDEFQRDGTSVLMLNQYEMQMYVEQQEKATYTEQANKRAHCRRLTSFIR